MHAHEFVEFVRVDATEVVVMPRLRFNQVWYYEVLVRDYGVVEHMEVSVELRHLSFFF